MGRTPTLHGDPLEDRHHDRRDAAFAVAKRAARDDTTHPTPTEVAVLHQRVLAGHPAAVEACIERLMPLLVRLIRCRFPGSPEDLVMNAVEDALLEYSRQPTQFDRNRGVPLVAFLRLAAERNALDALRAEARRTARHQTYAEQTLAAARERHRAAPIEQPFASLSATVRLDLFEMLSAEEQAAVTLWFQGERRTGPLARALDADHLPIDEQQKVLKRLKDRIRNRVKRAFHAVTPGR